MPRFFRNIIILLVVLTPLASFATHNRAGEITYTWLHDNTYQFIIHTYTDPNSPANRESLTIYYGDGVVDTLPRTFFIDISSTIRINQYTGIHSYSGPGQFAISMQDPNRVEGIINIAGSVNVPFFLFDTLFSPDPIFYGYNSSPVLLNPPIDYANVGQVFTHNPNAYDPDGDALRFSLIVPEQAPGIDVPGYIYPEDVNICPDTFIIDSLTGEIVWNAPCEVGIYNIAILVREYRDGRLVGKMVRDMEIFVEDNPNHTPIINAINDTCIIAGDLLLKHVEATDPDITQNVTLTAEGGPFSVTESPADFIASNGVGFATGDFSWQTTCNHIRKEFYEVVFKAEDDYKLGLTPYHLVDLETWLITVVAPPPLNVLATATGNQINVTWDSTYSCFNADDFLGFTVWRKIGCDSIQFDNCQRGLAGTGYDSIAFVPTNHHYNDFSVIRGQVYSYRIVALFGESSVTVPTFHYNVISGLPSDNSCAELKRDVPVINHVSVRETSAANGSIYIAWYKPLAEDLDTIQNPGPYKYVVNRYVGLTAAGSPTDIAEFTSPTFAAFNDTSIVDTLINTLSSAYTYIIDFYADGNKIGSTESASSVFLSSIPHDNRLILNWSFNVPWSNFRYDVYKEIPQGSGNYDSIATVTENTYTDDSLANGETYCYYIKAFGGYSSESLPDTLINLSEKHCNTPMDDEPPCAPSLAVHNVCLDDITNVDFDISDLKNDLTWTNPNHSCADDVLSYIIYYTSTDGGQLNVLDNILDGNDTTYTHQNLESLAGCYAVAAVDSFNNVSPLSNIVCVDNCADYVLPNAFTPNGDGHNDLFTPFLPYRFIARVDIKIYNSWGGIIYETTDPMINWDGKDMNTGKEVNEGVYYYVCDVYEITVGGVRPFQQPLKGYIHLIRDNKKSN